ncbi:MAG: DUF805 domain-containing protein [Verrucomicrobiales bacterium]|nr:DUF805 domain-containing protein [Verrucomicrobiales bacterium]
MGALLFSFKGRTNRLPFWLVAIGLSIIGSGFNFAIGKFNSETFEKISMGEGLFALLTFLFTMWVGLAVQVKRWHDRDKSGWWVLINLIPIIGTFWTVIECGFLSGSEGANRFGPNPKVKRLE